MISHDTTGVNSITVWMWSCCNCGWSSGHSNEQLYIWAASEKIDLMQMSINESVKLFRVEKNMYAKCVTLKIKLIKPYKMDQKLSFISYKKINRSRWNVHMYTFICIRSISIVRSLYIAFFFIKMEYPIPTRSVFKFVNQKQ